MGRSWKHQGRSWKHHGRSLKHQGSNFFNGHIYKFQLNEHFAYPNQILLIKEYGKYMQA